MHKGVISECPKLVSYKRDNIGISQNADIQNHVEDEADTSLSSRFSQDFH